MNGTSQKSNNELQIKFDIELGVQILTKTELTLLCNLPIFLLQVVVEVWDVEYEI